MKKRIFFKIFSGYFLITIALSGLILYFSMKVIRSFYISSLSNNLINIALVIELRIQFYLNIENYEGLDKLVKHIGNQIDTRITIIKKDGIVLADSEEDPKFMENHKDRPEIQEALNEDIGQSLRFSTTLKEKMLYIAKTINNPNGFSGVLRVSLFLSHINNLFNDLMVEILKIAIIVTLLSLLGAVIFSKSLSKPIADLAVASRNVASGDFDTKVNVKGKSELKDLAASFNYMTVQIKNLFNEISKQKEEINNIICSVREGLVVLDRDDKIKFANENFMKIVNNRNVEGKYYRDVISNNIITKLINKVRKEKEDVTERAEFDDKIYLCNAIFLTSKKDIIITFYDITRMSKLEQIKKDFVVNVSHELKTPMTAIKGYVETLEEEEDIQYQKYLGIIKRHTDRIINIIEDLLILSEIEERGAKLEFEKINFRKFLDNIIKIFEPKIDERILKIKYEIQENMPKIAVDVFKLEQVFINLIDNAIKYTEEGEIKITATTDNNKVIIKIEDEGIGIPEEHLSRIFERFYVVNKARSRKLGGTGLGLSIVKHIILMHNGKIEVESEQNKGTVFTIILPVNPEKSAV